MTLTAAAKIELIETALADGKYRTLQKQLRELRDAQQIILQRYLSDSHESLKEEAQRLIDELRPIAETQNAIETAEQRTDKVLASLPTETIANNLNFGNLTSDTEVPQDATTTVEQKLESEAKIYKTEFEAVIASLPVSTVVTNRGFESPYFSATPDQKAWFSKKVKHPSDIVIFKRSNLSAIAYAGDALRLIAILDTRSLVEKGALKTHIPMLDLEGVLHKAKKKGFNIKVSDTDQTVVLSKAS